MKQSPIFVKTFDFLKWILGRTEKFPKTQRFFLAKRINDGLFDFYEILGEAAALKGERQLQCLRDADVRLLRVKHYLKLAMELHFLSFKQFQYASEEAHQIGRLLGGWIKKNLSQNDQRRGRD